MKVSKRRHTHCKHCISSNCCYYYFDRFVLTWAGAGLRFIFSVSAKGLAGICDDNLLSRKDSGI